MALLFILILLLFNTVYGQIIRKFVAENTEITPGASILASSGSVIAQDIYTSTITFRIPNILIKSSSVSAISVYDNEVSAGSGASNNFWGVGIGINTFGNKYYGTGIGYNAYNNESNGVGIGIDAYNNKYNGIGIGINAYNNVSSGIGIGINAYNNVSSGIGIGINTQDNKYGGIGIGNNVYNNMYNGIGIGIDISSNMYNSIGIGINISSNMYNSIGIGWGASNNKYDSIGIGTYSQGNRDYAVSVGGYTFSVSSSVSLGWQARCENAESVSLGAGAKTTARRSIAIGAYTVNNDTNTVSFGNYKVKSSSIQLDGNLSFKEGASIDYNSATKEIRFSTNIFVSGNISISGNYFTSYGISRIHGTSGAVLGDEAGGWYIKVPNTTGITINPISGYNTLVNSGLDVMGDIGIMKAGNAFIGTTGNYNLSLRTNNTDRITITSDGKIGINKNNPPIDFILEKGGSVNLGISGSNTSETCYIAFYNFNNSGDYVGSSVPEKKLIADIMVTSSGDAGTYGGNIIFRTKPANAGGIYPRVYIGNNGNVGIGTTSPSEKLTVVGNIGLQAGTNAFVGTLDNYNLRLRTNNTDRITITNSGEMLISNLSNFSGIVGRIGGGGHPSGNTLVIGTTSQHSLVFITSNTQQMIISPEGRIGIGRHYNYNLPIYSSDVWLQILAPSSAWMRIQSDVGTAQSSGIYLKTAYCSALIGVYESPGGIGMQMGTRSPHYFQFITSNTIRMTILSNGNVGINTTSPSYTLHVNGSFAAASKNFDIPHPLDPENKRLIHATLEGPEYGVYYRGEAQLQNGRAIIELPSYFETLTRKEGRTVLLTNIDGFDKLCVQTQDGEVIKNGTFVVISDNPNSNQRFFWEVKAVRADIDILIPEKDIETNEQY